MKLAASICTIAFAATAWAQTSASGPATSPAQPKVRHIIGLGDIKGNASGHLTVRDGMLNFEAGKAHADIPIASIDDLFIGAETTQSGGKTGRVIKTAAIAAPFESGKALTILMRTKVDILTVAYHDSGNAMHGAIFALPKGQAEVLRGQLLQAGAHATPEEKPVAQETKK